MPKTKNKKYFLFFLFFIFGVLTPLLAIFQLYHGDQFYWWKKPEYPERTTDHEQATGKLYHLQCEFVNSYSCGHMLLQKRIIRTSAWTVRIKIKMIHIIMCKLSLGCSFLLLIINDLI
jgi:hypothetical protein